MATHLLHRLKRIERSMNYKGQCPICRDKGELVCITKQDGDPDPPIAPGSGCRGCGKYELLRLVYVDEDSMCNRLPRA